MKSRIDYFLISEAPYNYVSEARINKEELATKDHKMVVMTIRLSQFAQGMEYYRCPNNLLQDDIFKKVLKTKVEECMWKHTKNPMLTQKAQEQEHDTDATNLLMEIIDHIREVTAHYARRKHQVVTGDRKLSAIA